ncbi:hypothetical protein NUSPORA_00766 [Nucleospora cyclopteri]
MNFIKELTEMSTKIFKNIQSTTPEDLKRLEEFIKIEKIEYGAIRSFSVEESEIIVLLTFKQNCLILLGFLVENNINVPSLLLNAAFELLFHVKPNPKELSALMEKQRIEREIFNELVDIAYTTKYVNERVKTLVLNKSMPDDLSVNFALLIKGEFKSYELSVLNNLEITDVLVNFIESYKGRMRKIVKKSIIDELIKKMEKQNKRHIYSIFFMINEEAHNDLLESEDDPCEEFIGFVSSLIKNKAAAEIAFEKLQNYFEKLEEALKQFVHFSKANGGKLKKADMKTFYLILNAMQKLVKYKKDSFLKYLGLLQEVICHETGSLIKGAIYEILTVYLIEKDIFIKRILECRKEIEEEIKKQEFFLLPRAIKFINEYKRRVKYEEELVNIGKSIGSPYLTVEEFHPDYKILGLRSEDPTTVIECFDGDLSLETVKLNANHVRNAILKSSQVVEKVVEYQLKSNVVIDDISIINLTISTPNPNFFKYTRIFDDFSFYLNGDVLDRINDDLTDGLKFFNEFYTREIGEFMINNCNFFNGILQHDEFAQIKILKIYEKIVDDFPDKVCIKIGEFDSNTPVLDTFVVSGNEKYASLEFFRIFAKQLVYKHFFLGISIKNDEILPEYSSKFYETYVKAKLVVGLDVAGDLQFLKKNLVNIDQLIGFYNIVSPGHKEVVSSTSILANFGKKDSDFFLKNFNEATELERFILFFSLDKITPMIENVIKQEVQAKLKGNNKIYLDMCILHLFKCHDLDNLLMVLEKEYSDSTVLAKLALYNLTIGGKYFSKQFLEMMDRNLLPKALFFLYFNKIWDRDQVLQIVYRMNSGSSNELQMIVDDAKNFIN